MKETAEGLSVTPRLSKGRIEVDTPIAMFEFNITKEGLTPGARFAQSGHDLREVDGFHPGFALRMAQNWLAEARKNNPRI